ncbi:MAG: signal peptidase I [Myxococcales bacterium]|nr:signal peptidase I [Myxococcales bacterium]
MSEATPPKSRGGQPAPEVVDAKLEETGVDRWVANLRTIVAAVVLTILIRIVVIELFHIEGSSMQPTLLNGDRIVVAKYPYGLFLPGMDHAVWTWGHPNVGDIVIVHSPMDNVDIVKRVVGLPGDVIAYRDGELFRNGVLQRTNEVGDCEPAQEEHPQWDCAVYRETLDGKPHLISHSREDDPDRDLSMPVTVPPGHIFVMGDHRDMSNDSRNIGPIPYSRVKGHALFVFTSFSDAGGVRWGRFFEGLESR